MTSVGEAPAATPHPRISVVIVSYEVRELLRRCLETVMAQAGVEVECWVVDNASGDGSAEMVERDFPLVRVIRNTANAGFARANNQALERATGDPLLLLNPDTELPAGALTRLCEVFARHPEAGVVGLALHNPDGSWQESRFAFPATFNLVLEALGLGRVAARFGVSTPAGAVRPAGGEGRVEWVHGACFALSRRVYSAIGGLNPELFLYGEELDYCWRAERAGFATVHSEAASVLHHGGASGVGQRGPLFVKNVEGRLAFLRARRGPWSAAVAREILAFGCLLRFIAWRAIALVQSMRGGIAPATQAQLERFGAVVRWRWGGRA